MTEPITNPLFDWSIREDGLITIYITDSANQETRVVLNDIELSALNHLTEMADGAIAMFNEEGFDAVVAAINDHLLENQMTVTDSDFERLLDDD